MRQHGARDNRQRLADIVEACSHLEHHIDSADGLASGVLLQAAAQRWLEIIGEAVTRLSKELRDAHPAIAWDEVIGMRNILAHGYFHLDLDVVWSTITDDIPLLRGHIQGILAEL